MWYRPQELKTLFDVFRVSSDLRVKLVCGDTGRGGSFECSFITLRVKFVNRSFQGH